jgi:hypothetical protein
MAADLNYHKQIIDRWDADYMGSAMTTPAGLTNADLHVFAEEQLVNPVLRDEIAALIRARKHWNRIANATEAAGNALVLGSTVSAFAAGVYGGQNLAFAAGCLNTISLSLLKFSTYAGRESRERHDLLNANLARLNIEPIPTPAAPPPAPVGAGGGAEPRSGYDTPPVPLTPATTPVHC